MILIIFLILSSARAQADTGSSGLIGDSSPIAVPGELANGDGEGGGFMSTPREREAVINGAIMILSVVFGGGSIAAGGAALRTRSAMPASRVDRIADPVFAEMVESHRQLSARLLAIELMIKADQRNELLIEQGYQVNEALLAVADISELLRDSLTMAPKLASSEPPKRRDGQI